MKFSSVHNFFDGSMLQSVLSEMSYRVALERLGGLLIKRVAWRGPSNNKQIALTFDDGPHPTYTPALLDVLNQWKVPATFFVIGRHVQSYVDLAQEVARQGHEIGNHTYSHFLMTRLMNETITGEIQRTHDLIEESTASTPRFLRPPMGLFSRRVLDRIEDCGYQTVVGDVYPRDPHHPGKRKIVRRILDRTRSGSIIILHDGGNTPNVNRQATVDAVKEVIPLLQGRGFRFVTLSEMFGKPEISSLT
jgi:peptidoglycan/xylan/chitin deacetylase (PgdA/CDA1 family)